MADAFGGEYQSRELSSYANDVCRRVADNSDGADPSFIVTVLDTPIVNAFSLPGGHIYLTRGILALMNNEAQLAGVLAHEVGHMLAAANRQAPAERMSQQPGDAPLSTAGDEPLVMRGMKVDALDFLRPVAEQAEFEADVVAVHKMTKAGYDPRAMASLLASMRDYESLAAKTVGRSPDSPSPLDYTATHTNAIDSYNRALAASANDKTSTQTRVDPYLRQIDGMPYGESAGIGFINGTLLESPKWRVRLVVPKGFQLFATKQRVYGLGPRGSLIALDLAPEAPSGPLSDYVANVWGKGTDLRNLRSGRLRGMDAASAITTSSTPNGLMELRIFVVRIDPTHVLRVRDEFPTEEPAADRYGFLKMISTIAPASGESATINQRRLRVIEVRPIDTSESLANRCAFVNNLKLQLFRAINGLEPHDELAPGRLIKLVIE